MEKQLSSLQTSCDVPALWKEHTRELQNYIARRVNDKEVAKDILQEVLMKVYKFCLIRFGVKNLRSWLFQIAHNTIIDHYRHNAKYTDKGLPDLSEEDKNMAFKEAVNFMEPMLGFLPEEYSVPLKLADLDGMKQAEIAEKLNLSLPATKSRIQRERQLLKAEFLICCNLETDARGNLISFAIKDSCTTLKNYQKKKYFIIHCIFLNPSASWVCINIQIKPR